MADAILRGCPVCNRQRRIFDFLPDNRTCDGLSKRCRQCTPAGNRASSVCGACGQPKELGKDCIPCGRRRNAEYKGRHAERVRQSHSAYKKALHAAGAAERAERRRKKMEESARKRVEAKRLWKLRNPGLVNASTAQRFAAKMRATPAWADRAAIEFFYVQAAARGEHVDHIVPLRSSLVCGLHCEANLQLLPPTENIRKGNRRWPDMWEPL